MKMEGICGGQTEEKTAYDAEKAMKELMVAVVESYENPGELKLMAEEFEMFTLKIRKLLITAGAYSNDLPDGVNIPSCK